MNIVLLSQSIKTNHLSKMKSSSAKFEYSFAWNLSKYTNFNVTVLTTALTKNKICETKERNFKIVGIQGENIKENFINFENYITLVDSKDIAVIYYGYDLRNQLNIFRLKKRLDFITIPFIFDSHQGATENFNWFKKQVSNLYFKISILLLNCNDAFLLFNKQAVEELNIKKPFLITKPGLQINNLKDKKYHRKNKKFVLLYTGTLIKYNGISELLEAFSKIDNDIFHLRIFGNGPLKDEVIEYSNNDDRIFYGGVVESGELRGEYDRADLLINLRDPNHYVSKYSFPSKLIEYISFGKPILTTDLNFDVELADGLYIVKKLTPKEVKNKILEIESESDEMKNNKIKKAQNVILEKNNWNKLIKEVELFFIENDFT